MSAPTSTQNTPATPPGKAVSPTQCEELPSQVSQVPPGESEPGNRGTAALQAWREAGGIPGPRLDPIERLATNPTSLRLAINAKCYDCQGQDADPNWQRRVGECGCTTCPLHAVRPYQR